MIGALTFENFNLFMPDNLAYSSDSIVDSIDRAEEKILEDKFAELRGDVGAELFDQLSPEDKIYMASVVGTIDFGHPIDLLEIAKYIRNYYDADEDNS
ncbi:hypothetical protein A2Y83_01745 [Candidatus Falkowbacteria bacterium RBG_13_39_14]|uniref:Uncharacterized protein n=1 Tax=Candidatus Falkowbacteria bacterium RBG_13_39_14 TaxID=1797985 RepID=A0A1F5S600_9BACT|nr:MAG: hypothetical protein A2Y83_01745 [Candidatus Falkowbacteria bacterium RBG_13_39_14]